MINLVNITNGVFHYYKTAVNNNHNDDFLNTRKKLTRNIFLAELINVKDDIGWYRYGCLNIHVDIKTHTVIRLYNKKGLKCRTIHINKDYKEFLNKELDIR